MNRSQVNRIANEIVFWPVVLVLFWWLLPLWGLEIACDWIATKIWGATP